MKNTIKSPNTGKEYPSAAFIDQRKEFYEAMTNLIAVAHLLGIVMLVYMTIALVEKIISII